MSDRPYRVAWGVGAAWIALVLAVPAVHAHPGHKHPSPPPAASPTSAATPATVAPSAEPAGEASPLANESAAPAEPAVPEELPDPLKPFPWKSIFTEHLHNKLIHFPLAFGIAAALFLLAGRRWPSFEPAARVLLLGAALAAVGAFFTGRMQQEPFEDGALAQVLKFHRLMGITTAISLWVGVALTSRAGARRFWPFYAVWLIAIILATATFGGLLSHGEL